jgi:hypothetical protein
LLAAAPVAAMQQPAAAAQNSVEGTASLTFVTDTGGVATCTVTDDATHNTDDPNQPYIIMTSGLSGGDSACFDFVSLTITVSYKDKGGVRRTAVSNGFATSSLQIGGVYSGITTSVRADFFGCNPSASATCNTTAVANPK